MSTPSTTSARTATIQTARDTFELEAINGRLIGESIDSGLAGRFSAVFQLDRGGYLFWDLDRAGNGTFVDMCVGRTLDDVEAQLRQRAGAQPGHASAEYDAADAQALANARATLAAESKAGSR